MNATRRLFLKQLGLGASGFVLFSPGNSRAWADERSPMPRSTRQKIELHSFMVVRHGSVVAEGWWAPYAAEFRHGLYSLSKSFTSTAVGLAVAEGKLSVEDKVVSFFPKDLPETVSENLAAVRVKDLLTMSVGHAQDPTFEMVKAENWVKAFLAWPIPNAPGTNFVYNSGATYTLSAIVQLVTGQTAAPAV